MASLGVSPADLDAADEQGEPSQEERKGGEGKGGAVKKDMEEKKGDA